MWYPYPPYYKYPPHYVYPPGVAFTVGIFVGAAIWGNCNWHGGNVNVHVSHYNSFNRTNINNPNWNHNVDHRKGVPYKDKGVAQKYNRGANDKGAQSREDFRGRAETGRAEMKDMDRSELQNHAAQADRAQQADRDRASQADRDRALQRGSGSYDRGGGSDRASANDARSTRPPARSAATRRRGAAQPTLALPETALPPTVSARSCAVASVAVTPSRRRSSSRPG